ncbi:MAG: hypothetical protein KatS3mg068_1155 [Candidatus Sericytochromatia bacterium]|nr:MAG: hypothetical protein KatS3mg068_1155 [Candidatus Sericytochromatia bacterium]
MFEKLSQESIKIVMLAQEEAKFLNSSEVEPEHILLGILKESNSSASKLLYEKGISHENLLKRLEQKQIENNKFPKFGIQFSHSTNEAIELALNEANKLSSEIITPEHLLLGIISLGEGLVITILKDYGINLNRIRWELSRINKKEDISTPNILLLTSDITNKIINNEINTVIIRDRYVEEIIYNLNSYKKTYPIIIGEKGVGKTSIIYSLVQCLLDGNIFKELQSFKVLYFSFNNLLSEYLNFVDINKSFKLLINELKQVKDSILVIEDLDFIFDEKLINSNIINILLDTLENQKLYFIFSSSFENYEKEIKKSRINKYLNAIEIHEATELETKIFLEHWKNKFTEFHNIDIDDLAIDSIIKNAKKIYPHEKFPEIAFKILDIACSKKKYSKVLAQNRIKDMERHLRILRNKRDEYIKNNNLELLEEIKKEAQEYENEIMILKNNISSSLRLTLSEADIKLLVDEYIKPFT